MRDFDAKGILEENYAFDLVAQATRLYKKIFCWKFMVLTAIVEKSFDVKFLLS